MFSAGVDNNIKMEFHPPPKQDNEIRRFQQKAVGFERVLFGASHIELSGDQPQMHRQLWCTRVNKLFVFARIHCLVQS